MSGCEREAVVAANTVGSSRPIIRYQVEHVIARQHGGLTADGNLAWAFAHCNLHKGPRSCPDSVFRRPKKELSTKDTKAHEAGIWVAKLYFVSFVDNSAEQTRDMSEGPNFAGIDPLTGALSPLFHPRMQNWADHFELVGPLVIGRTEVGRATVRVLNINAPRRVELRSIRLS